MAIFTAEPIEHETLRTHLKNSRAGACVVFEGWVRNHNEGKEVQRLEYESYISMAEKVIQKIVHETQNTHQVYDIVVRHRVGLLEIGDIAVWIGVTGPHRGDCFKACERVIDQLKKHAPIWKREHYKNEAPQWVQCHHH